MAWTNLKMLRTPSANSATVFHFKPFSDRQKKILTWWMPGSPYRDYTAIIADGAIRSGKTVSMITSYIMWAMQNFNGQQFGLCGKTIGSLRRNVINDMKKICHGRGYRVQHKRGEKLLIVTRGETTNYFYEFGGRDEASQDLIQGVTLAGVLFDEVALMPQSFVNQATGRCSVEGSKFWFNCNPSERMHWFKLEWINKYQEKKILYLHFTMEDNYALSEEIKARYRAMYTGAFYRRYIQGQWCAAEGAIYDDWTEEKNGFDAVAVKPWEIPGAKHVIGVDYGTTNPTAFVDCYDDGVTIWVAKEYYQDSRAEQKQKTVTQHADDFDEFTGGDHNAIVYVDPAAAEFKLELKNRGYWVRDGVNDVLPGIETVAALIHLGLIKADRGLSDFRKELASYVWDEKARMRGIEQPVKQKDHLMDALRYAVHRKNNRFEMQQRARAALAQGREKLVS